ncbi:MAG: CsgG/HfaB family protein, partial [Planctomycetales bacterium]
MKRMHNARFASLACFLFVFVFAVREGRTAEPQPVDRVLSAAIISEDGRELTRDLIALAEVHLSGNASVRLLERRRVADVLAEQALSLSGLVDAESAAKIGRLLQADLLAVVATEPQSRKALGMVVFESRTGAHLDDRALPVLDGEAASKAIADGILHAAAKRNFPVAKLRAVSFVSIRSVDLPASDDHVREGVGRLVERVLTTSPNLLVLERRRLDTLRKEAALGKFAAQSWELKLLASINTVDLEISRRSTGGLSATATVYGSSGARLEQVTAHSELSNAAFLAEASGRVLAKALEAQPARGTIDVKAEARRFAREALVLYRHNQLDRARTSLEIALDFDGDNPDSLDFGARILFYSASETLEPHRFHLPPRPIHTSASRVAEALRLGARGLELLHRFHERRATEGKRVPRFLDEVERAADGTIRLREESPTRRFAEIFMQRASLIARGHSGKTRGQFDDARKSYQRLYLEAIDRPAYDAVRDGASFRRYTHWLRVLLQNVELMSSTPAAWADVTCRLIDRWLDLAEKHGVRQSRFFTSNLLFAELVRREGQLDRLGQTGKWLLEPQDAKRFTKLHARMREHRAPAVRVFGELVRLWAEFVMPGRGSRETTAAFAEFVQQAEQVLVDPGTQPRDARLLAYHAWLDAIQLLPERLRQEAVQELFQTMIGRKELARGVGWTACNPVRQVAAHYRPLDEGLSRRFPPARVPQDRWARLLANIDQISRLADDPETIELDDQTPRLRAEVHGFREQILSLQPQPNPPRKSPWARRLLHVSEHESWRAISRMVVRGDHVYCVGIGNSAEHPQGFLQLVEINPDAQTPTISPLIPCARGASPPTIPRYSANCRLDVAGRTAYIGTFYQGLLSVSLDDHRVRRLNRANELLRGMDLPSDRIASVA